MKIDEWTSEDVHTSGGWEFPPCAGLTFNVLPEAQSTVSAESSQTGVSTRNAHIASKPKVQKDKRKVVTESRLPNIFFAYGTEEQLKTFVYDNVNLPFLRFYYRHVHVGRRIDKRPLIVPNYQMESLKIICAANTDNTIVSIEKVQKFEKGQLVKIVDGAFKGVVGKVARWQGQQRVGVVVDDLVTVVTAYVPSAFLEKII